MKRIVFIVLLISMFLSTIVNAEDEWRVVSKTTKYYKTTYYESEEEAINNINNNDIEYVDGYYYITYEISYDEYMSVETDIEPAYNSTVTSEYKELSTYIMTNGSKYRYRVTLDWRKFPKVRSYDIIGLGHYDDVKVSGSVYFNTEYCTTDGTCSCLLSYTKLSYDEGNSVIFKLPSDSLIALTSTLYYDVEKVNSSDTITKQKAAGDYAHAKQTVTLTSAKKHYVDYYGITFTNGIGDYYDSINTAYAGTTESW